MIIKLTDTQKAGKLFDGWQETMIWSCIQDIMGCIYVDNAENPRCGAAVLGYFCFLAGTPDREMVMFIFEQFKETSILAVPQNDAWADLIKHSLGTNAKERKRYAIKKDTRFDKKKLEEAVRLLNPAYTIQRIDENLFKQCEKKEWSRDLVSQFKDYEAYRKLGMGFVALKDGLPVSGASSYSRYREGIEIEIDTEETCRNQGLAYACGARLILACLEQGLYPSWDAHDKRSVALAQKLGYQYAYDYSAFEIGLF